MRFRMVPVSGSISISATNATHYGAFLGNYVTLHQDNTVVFRPYAKWHSTLAY